MDNFFDLDYTDNQGNVVKLDQYRDKPVLIVNTASKCGFTPQYQGLQKLYEELGPQGLVILGFPCDQFGHQEPGNDAEIAEFCTLNFGVSFPLSAKVDVNGSKTSPVFEFVKKQAGGVLGSAIKWNFTKFLVSPNGVSVKRYAPTTKPQDIRQDAEALLSQ